MPKYRLYQRKAVIVLGDPKTVSPSPTYGYGVGYGLSYGSEG